MGPRGHPTETPNPGGTGGPATSCRTRPASPRKRVSSRTSLPALTRARRATALTRNLPLPKESRAIYLLTVRSKQVPGNSPTFTEKARRAQILACAIEVIAESGYGQASLAKIARRAGVSKGVISYYFAGKEELLGHVLVDVYARAGAGIGIRLAPEDGPVAQLRGYLEANLDFLRDHLADIRAVVEIATNARRPDGALRFSPGDADPVLEHLVQLLRDGQTSGDFRDFDARSVALMIRGAIDTASGRLVTDPSFDLSRYTRELIILVELATRKAP